MVLLRVALSLQHGGRRALQRVQILHASRASKHAELEAAVFGCAFGGNREAVADAFCNFALGGSSTEVLREEPWNDRERWAEILKNNGKSIEQRLAMDALDGGSRRAIDSIKAAIALKCASVPRRIEALDVSHMYGEYPVVSCAVVVDGEIREELGWTWQIDDSVTPGDDCGGLRFGLERRLREEEKHADVLLIDGGKTQLAAVVSLLIERNERHDHVVALAKGERNDGVVVMRAGEKLLYHNGEVVEQIGEGEGVPKLFRLARDAAHSRALRAHRELRNTAFMDNREAIASPKPRRKVLPRASKDELNTIEQEQLRRSWMRAYGVTTAIGGTSGRDTDLYDSEDSFEKVDEASRIASQRTIESFRKLGATQLEERKYGEFAVTAPYETTLPQRDAVEAVVKRLVSDREEYGGIALLKGATGTGKTHCMARLIERRGIPAVVLAPNKVLAAQLYGELKELLGTNAVEFFVSYYDYYRPESFTANKDVYRAKRSIINDKIDALRHHTISSVLTRRDVVVVASISCAYGLGLPRNYQMVTLKQGDDLLSVVQALETLGYEEIRSDDDVDSIDLSEDVSGLPRASFRVASQTDGTTELSVVPSDSVTTLTQLVFSKDQLLATILEDGALKSKAGLYPATLHHSMNDIDRVCRDVMRELEGRLRELRSVGKSREADRLESRTLMDVKNLQKTGKCAGIENYSRHISGAAPGDPPVTLLDYFPPASTPGDSRFLLIIDESHLTLGQIAAVSSGDRARKDPLVENGFRLPSARDNRPLAPSEVWDKNRVSEAVLVSATPGKLEADLLRSRARFDALSPEKPVAELVIRPTMICDPQIEVRPRGKSQVDDALHECIERARVGEKSIIVTISVASAKNVVKLINERNLPLRAAALTGDVKPPRRLQILSQLRNGTLDTVVGVSLLREGIDLDVSLMCILDADKEGFLRSDTALIQIIGRCARHIHGRALLYADRITGGMQRAIDETNARRSVQEAYNTEFSLKAKPIVYSDRYAVSSMLGDYEEDAVESV